MQPGQQAPVHAQHQLVQEVLVADRGVLDRDAEARELALAQQHQPQVVLQQAEGVGHAAQRMAEIGGAERGARDQRQAAAAHPAREETQRLVVEPVHQEREQRHVLLGRDARARLGQQRRRHARVFQRPIDVDGRGGAAGTDAGEHAFDEGDRDGDGRLQHGRGRFDRTRDAAGRRLTFSAMRTKRSAIAGPGPDFYHALTPEKDLQRRADKTND